MLNREKALKNMNHNSFVPKWRFEKWIRRIFSMHKISKDFNKVSYKKYIPIFADSSEIITI